jgi:hypothetical protein
MEITARDQPRLSRRVLLGRVLRSAEGPQFASGGSYQGIASSDATKRGSVLQGFSRCLHANSG